MIYRVALSSRCACNDCAGELIEDPLIEEYSSLGEAVAEYERLRDQVGDNCSNPEDQPSDYPPATSRQWYATARNHDLGCDGNGREEVILSLPVDDMTPSSLWRINNLLAKRWRY